MDTYHRYSRETDDRRYDQQTVGMLAAIVLSVVSVVALICWATM